MSSCCLEVDIYFDRFTETIQSDGSHEKQFRDGEGNIVRKAHPYAYDEDGNISRLTIGNGTEEGLLYDAFMLYDLNGNRTGKNGTRLSADGKQTEMAVSYRYDSMNRLTNEDRDGIGERYAYDLCGNRLLKEQYSGSSVDVTEGYRYNERNELTERISAGGFTVYRYDKNGSIISEEKEGRKSEYHYDLLNRQTYVKTLDGKEQENFYDGEGLRAGLTENGKKTTFLFHDGEILAECDGDSAPIRRYVRGNGLSCIQTLDNNAYHAYHQDEQGNTAYITGQRVENCYQYDVFGNLTEKREGFKNRILYTGQQYDQETGQYYLRARYYNPVVGRFLQEDTYRGDGLNLYAYCANNPVMYYDPSGQGKNNCSQGSSAKTNETQGNQAVNGGSNNTKPNQVHHFATDKSKTYTQQFKDIVSNYGLDLDGDWNKESLPHQGRHPNAYHDFVLDKMQEIDNIANGNKDVFLDLYEKNIKAVIRDNYDMLYSDYWKNLGRK